MAIKNKLNELNTLPNIEIEPIPIITSGFSYAIFVAEWAHERKDIELKITIWILRYSSLFLHY